MPRETSLPVVPRPKLKDQLYTVRAESVEKNRSPAGLRIVLRHTEGKHDGRRHEHVLKEPLYPDSLLGEFMAATGQTVTPGQKVFPKQSVGKTILAKFKDMGSGYEPVAFAPIKENHDDNE